MKVLPKIEEGMRLSISVISAESDYDDLESQGIDFCEICGAGQPMFVSESSSDDYKPKYLCKDCILEILEEMKRCGAESWKRYEATLDADCLENVFLIDLEEHKARRLQIFGT